MTALERVGNHHIYVMLKFDQESFSCSPLFLVFSLFSYLAALGNFATMGSVKAHCEATSMS
jgi:hypothetical protein